MCMARAIVIGQTKYTATPTVFRALKREHSREQTRLATNHCRHAGVSKHTACGINEAKRFQQVLPDFQITIFQGTKNDRLVLWEGPRPTVLNPRNHIDLLYDHEDAHYDVIVSLPAAFDASLYCRKCHKGYAFQGAHFCDTKCWRCLRTSNDCDQDTAALIHQCPQCYRNFKGDICFANHLELTFTRNRTVCDVLRICRKCGKFRNLRDRKTHTCYEIYCNVCRRYDKPGHKCYMRVIEPPKPDTEKKNYELTIYFDIETSQCDLLDGKTDVYEHKPIFLVSQQNCLHCSQLPIAESCEWCSPGSGREIIFRGENIMGDFFDSIRTMLKVHDKRF
jgi:hypothetical protein